MSRRPTMYPTGGKPNRSSLPSRTAPVRFAAFTLDLDRCSLLRADGGDVALTHDEFALLREFVRHPGRVLSSDYLLDALVGKHAGPFDRGVDVLVGRLRRKIEADPKQPRLIVTVSGEGYRFDGLTKTFQSAPTGRALTVNPSRVEPRNVVEGADKPMDAAAGSTARLEHPAAPRLSLVVLPFANISGDASQDYFVDV
jgi:DNA-binding winged helix-turn-helix (wHTH) protein